MPLAELLAAHSTPGVVPPEEEQNLCSVYLLNTGAVLGWEQTSCLILACPLLLCSHCSSGLIFPLHPPVLPGCVSFVGGLKAQLMWKGPELSFPGDECKRREA